MLDLLYTFSYLASLLGLILWFYFSDHKGWSKLMRNLFFVGILAYLAALTISAGGIAYKLMILFRDLMVLGLVAQFFRLFRNEKFIFFLMLIVLLATFKMKYQSVLYDTFPEIAEQTTQLDPQGELLVEVKENEQLEKLSTLMDTYELEASPAFQMLRPGSTDLDDYVIVNVPTKHLGQLEEIQQAFYDSGLVDWVEENEQISLSPLEIQKLPSKTKRKYGINDPGLNRLWGFEEMEVDQLYRLLSTEQGKAKKKARIVILDTGVDARHEDLQSNYFSIRKKYDQDDNRHGTHCAGIAASVSNNGKGIASFAPNGDYVEVSSIQVLSAAGSGTQAKIIQGILEAADNGADVISMSLGGRSKGKRQRAYSNAVKYANKRGAIVVAAAGNSNMNAKDYSPANTPGVITVSALDTVLGRASFSNFVQDVPMGIAAPGVAIYSTVPGSKYESLNGTSMATPYVAGLLGIMKSLRPELTTREAYDILHRTGKDTNSKKETGKLIMPARAVEALFQLQ